MSWKFGPDMRTNKMRTDMVGVRDDIMGNRIANFKALGGCKSLKPLDWTFGVYKATFQGDELKQVRHWNGDTVQVDELGKHIDRTWIIQSNWDDMDAYFSKPPLAPQLVRAFFEAQKTGPFAMRLLRGNDVMDAWKATVRKADVVAAAQTALQRQAGSVGGQDGIAKARASLGTLKRKQAEQRATSAQAKALESLKNKKMQRGVRLLRRRSSAVSDPDAATGGAEASTAKASGSTPAAPVAPAAES